MKDEKHLELIRGMDCLVYQECDGNTEPHHIRTSYNCGMARKPDDRYTVPLCQKHHTMAHAQGDKRFFGMRNINHFEVIARIIIENDPQPF